MTHVRIAATAEEYAESFHAAVDYFVRGLVGGAGVQFLAVTADNKVVGWCDIIRNPLEGFRHVGRLGTGLLPEYRRRGLGRRLATKAIGFLTEGIKHKARKLDGAYEDNVLMALINDA